MKNHHPFMSGNSIWEKFFLEWPHQTIILNKGDIYFPDEHKDYVAVITEGLLKVFLSDSYGEERFMWLVEPYSLIHWNDRDDFTHNLVAIKKTKLYLMKRQIFMNQVRSSSILFEEYIKSIYQKYTYCIEKLIVSDTHNSQFKVYSFLLHLASRYGTTPNNGGIKIENIITRQDISSITGVHRVNIIKYLGQLEELNIIEKDRKSIYIKDVHALQQLIESLDIEQE